MLENKKPEKAEAVEEKKPDEQAKLFSLIRWTSL